MKTNREPTNHIDDGNDDACDRVPSNKLTGTIHRSIEIGLTSDFLATPLSFLFVNGPSIEVRIDCHLPAGHPVQCKSGRHFTNSRCAFGDHNKLDHHNDHEDDQPYDNPVTSNKIAESLNNSARSSVRIGLGLRQNQSGCGDIQDQSTKRRREQ